MKKLLALAFLLMMSFAHAAQLDGTLDSISPIKVLNRDNQLVTYSAAKLTFVSLKDDTVWLDQGFRSRCSMPALGKLLEDVVIRVKTNEGSFKTIVVEKETAGKKVSLWGDCQKGSTDLDQLTISVHQGTLPVTE